MARKPTEIVQVNLRIREDLRRRLEAAAKKRQVSLNFEMAARLEQSFQNEALNDLQTIVHDMGVQWTRLVGDAWKRRQETEDEQQADLVSAVVDEVLGALSAQPLTVHKTESDGLEEQDREIAEMLSKSNNPAMLELARKALDLRRKGATKSYLPAERAMYAASVRRLEPLLQKATNESSGKKRSA